MSSTKVRNKEHKRWFMWFSKFNSFFNFNWKHSV